MRRISFKLEQKAQKYTAIVDINITSKIRR